MFRVLATVFAAEALLTAAPALAEQRDRESEPPQLPACCERVAMQMREHDARARDTEKKTTEQKATQQNEQKAAPRAEEDPFIFNYNVP